MVRIRGIVDEFAALLEPGVDGAPRNVDVAGRLCHPVVGERCDVVGEERVAEGMAAAVHHQRPLRVDDRASVEHRPDASRVRFDEDHVRGQRCREPTGGVDTQWAAAGDETHRPRFTNRTSIVT
jgi:hypothetical protein